MSEYWETHSDATPEPVMIDSDGDGWMDTAVLRGDAGAVTVMTDRNLDGLADTVASDIDGDGQIDAVVHDLDGDGIVDRVVTAEHVESIMLVDADQDGVLDGLVLDRGDGAPRASVAFPDSTDGNASEQAGDQSPGPIALRGAPDGTEEVEEGLSDSELEHRMTEKMVAGSIAIDTGRAAAGLSPDFGNPYS